MEALNSIGINQSMRIIRDDFPATLKYSLNQKIQCVLQSVGLEYANSFQSVYDFINYLDSKKSV